MISIKDLPVDELKTFIKTNGNPSYCAIQLFEWVYKKGVLSFDEMTNLSLPLRSLLNEKAFISSLKIKGEQVSVDGTTKYVFTLSDDQTIESVLIKDDERLTICISTQVGCKIKCLFCFTGRYGWKRNLTPSEIVDQIIDIKKKNNIATNIKTNIVFMGMGEPLDNYENVVRAIKILTAKSGLEISPKRITLSTCGLIPELNKLSAEKLNVNIAISLNAASDELRTQLMPINKTYPLHDLLQACKTYNMPKRARISIEYVMLKGKNDSLEEAKKLANILRKLKCKINLIPYNGPASGKIEPPSNQQVEKFQNILKEKRYSVFIRKSKGGDIMAACGQLGSAKNSI